MNKTRIRIAAAATVVALGGLAGLALSDGHKQASTTVAAKPAVHTKVIRRTIHVTKHAKPKHPAPGGSASGASTGSSAYGESSGSAVTGASSTGASATEASPVTTATSGGGTAGVGGGEESEHESEGGVDD